MTSPPLFLSVTRL